MCILATLTLRRSFISIFHLCVAKNINIIYYYIIYIYIYNIINKNHPYSPKIQKLQMKQ